MSDWPRSIGLVGCGSMGRAMLAGLRRGEDAGGAECVVVDVMVAAAEEAAAESGGQVGTLTEAARCDLVVLAVKPKDAAEALGGIAGGFGERTVLLSVVAGLDLDRIAAVAGRAGLARSMPNLAVRHGAGLIALATRNLGAAALDELFGALAPLGAVVVLPEHLLGPATALVGSGPGFVALVAEGLEDGGVAIGFPREQARLMVQAVLAGSAALLADGSDPADLRQRVSSPAGTTIEGIGVLERGSVRAHIADAVRAAARRAAELT